MMDATVMIKQTVDTIGSIDLREEGRAAIARGESVEFASYQLREDGNLITEWVDVAYFKGAGRAGAAWGGPAQWFDAASAEEAIAVWLAAQNGDADALARIEAN